MKCPEALEAMLDAEPSDLSPDGSSALAMHVRSCAKCARVAATMRADVHALAAVMPGEPAATRAPVVPWREVALACAAAVIVFVVTRAREVPAVRTQPLDSVAVAVTPPAEVVRDEPVTPRAAEPGQGRPVAAVLYAMPEPILPESTAGVDDPAWSVAASPPAPAFDGVSASSAGSVTVLKTSNPKITVIWFN